MKFTTRSEYALLALIYLTRNYDKEYIPLSQIAREQNIPPKYLENLITILCHAGYISSLKGQHGGYRLARSPGKITLAQVVRLLDGALAPSSAVSKYYYKPSPIEKEEKMVHLLKEIRDYESKKLESTTLTDIT